MNDLLPNRLLTNAGRSPRAGSSLIEIIVLLSVSSTLLLIAVGWIHQSMRLATVLRDHERHHQSLMRLSRQFRDDAHAARTITGDGSEVAFAMDEMTVRYEVESNVVRRRQMNETSEVIFGEETYHLRDRAVVTLDLTDSPHWVSLVVHRRPLSEPPPGIDSADDEWLPFPLKSPRDLMIHAAVGRWHEDVSDLSEDTALGEKP